MTDPYAGLYDQEMLERLAREGRPWDGEEVERLRQQGVCDERTQIPAGLLPSWVEVIPVGIRDIDRLPPGRRQHGG